MTYVKNLLPNRKSSKTRLHRKLRSDNFSEKFGFPDSFDSQNLISNIKNLCLKEKEKSPNN